MFFGKINRFLRNRIASIAPIFAIMAVPMIVVAGAATDIARHHNTNEYVQMALDSAGLAAARHARTNMSTPAETLNAEVEAIAKAYFKAQIKEHGQLLFHVLEIKRKGSNLHLSVEGAMATTFMKFAGQKFMRVKTESEITVGVPSSVEIALVLDMSESMKGTRLTALQDAAIDLVDTLVDPTKDTVKMSIVPFGQYVNVGTDNRKKSWIKVPDDEIRTETRCVEDDAYLDKICTWKWVDCVKDGVDDRCWQRTDCDEELLAAAEETCTDYQKKWRWFGCVRSRRTPRDVRDTFYSAYPVRGFLSQVAGACASPITPLTNSANYLKKNISALSPRGTTYITQGLYWGYRTLSPGAPFSEGKSQSVLKSQGGFKTLVLMSDGANTLYNNNELSWDQEQGLHFPIPEESKDAKGHKKYQKKADDRTMMACTKVKRVSIEIYTIAFEVDDEATEKLLKECATSPSHYFKAENADQLKKAFKDIAAAVQRDIAVAA